MRAENQYSQNQAKMEGIDLVKYLKNYWIERKLILKVTMIFIALGVVIAFLSRKEYTASAILVPQVNNPAVNFGSLSSLASLAGFNLDMGAGGFDVSPILYPKIVKSTSFQMEIMNQKFSFSELEENISLYQYYQDYYKLGVFEILEKYTRGLPGILRKTFQKEVKINTQNEINAVSLTVEQNDIRKKIEKNLYVEINEKEGYLILISEFHQAQLSAQVALKAQELLQEYITKLKTEKAQAKLSFIEERYLEKRKSFEEAQLRLAIFRDRNKNILSSRVKTEEEKLENEFQLAFEVYSELAKQLEQAKIQVKEDTPVFSVIQEVTVPVEKSKPQRLLILILWTLAGIIFGIIIVSGKFYLPGFKQRWDNIQIGQ